MSRDVTRANSAASTVRKSMSWRRSLSRLISDAGQSAGQPTVSGEEGWQRSLMATGASERLLEETTIRRSRQKELPPV